MQSPIYLPDCAPSAPPLGLTLAIVGATGAVGAELVRCLEAGRVPVAALRLVASAKSAGQRIVFQGVPHAVEALHEGVFAGIDLAFFAAGARLSRRFVWLAREAGAQVIDLSSAHRTDPNVPLVVPEANGHALEAGVDVVANPNCVAAIAAVVIAPLVPLARIRRLHLATYQAVSGAGASAMAELQSATAARLAGVQAEPQVFPHPCAFNLFSHDSEIDLETGQNGEEIKVSAELRRILERPDLPVGVTCIRVPVLRAHGIALTVEFETAVAADQARAALAQAPGVILVDDPARNHFPMPSEATGRTDVLVGRIRPDQGDPSGRSLALFVVGDQLLKGAAWNAVQIAETMARARAR